MGTLAKTLGCTVTVEVAGMSVSVKQLSVNELFECMREAFRSFEEREKSIDLMAQEAIETGRVPLTSLSILIGKACPDLDDDDVNALLSGSNLESAYRIAAAAMGNEVTEENKAEPKKEQPKKK